MEDIFYESEPLADYGQAGYENDIEQQFVCTEETIIEGLNDEQKAAVLNTEGPTLIIAGAGSGKTRVLTSKIALLLARGVAPESILALTFTKKAANEMKQRIRTMVGESASRLVMGTFHSIFIQFLRRYCGEVGFSQTFTIYDEDDSEGAIKDVVYTMLFGKDWRLTGNKDNRKQREKAVRPYKPSLMAKYISDAKNALIGPKAYALDERLLRRDKANNCPELHRIYELYMKKCRTADAMDFDDILLYMNFLLNRYPDICRALGEQFKYILVDEYQDTNVAQYAIVKKLAQVNRNISVVGDDSQSIYAFRGAKIENILNFRRDYPDYRQFKLVQNYRSSTDIVEAANRLIEHNSQRLPKDCVAVKGQGEAVAVQECEDDREEASFIARMIKILHGQGDRKYSSMAVLYRTNVQSRIIEDIFMRNRIPYYIYSGTSFFDRMEVKDALAFLRLAVNHNDDAAFKRVCNKPSRGISDATIGALSALSFGYDKSLYSIACECRRDAHGLKKAACAAVVSFAELIEKIGAAASQKSVMEAVKDILEMTGIYDFYKNMEGEDGERRSANIDELMGSVEDYVNDCKETYRAQHGTLVGMSEPKLSGYLENIALLSNIDMGDGRRDAVNVMTAHCAKGLEFPTVFITGCEEKLFPLVKDDSGTFDLEEERRLFYVAATRAMDELVMTVCLRRRRYNKTENMQPSRFIAEMGLPFESHAKTEGDSDDYPELI